MGRRREINREIHGIAEIEREAERAAEFADPGGLFHRFFLWVARLCAIERAKLRDERDGTENRPDRRAPGDAG